MENKQASPPNSYKFRIKTLLSILFGLLIFFVLFELASLSYISIKKPDIPQYNIIPTYLNLNKNDLFDTLPNPISPRYIDTLYPWCTWHPRNSTHRLVKSCLDVTTTFNNLGTRGALPDSKNENTVIFVGDSFTEGYGVVDDSTVSERIKNKLLLPVLNLGCGGYFGTTQMSLAYADFAKTFRHNRVYVFFYLNNDFAENNIHNHTESYSDRYRPYRVFRNDGTDEIIYKGNIDSTNFSWKRFNEIKVGGFLRLKKLSIYSFFNRYDKDFFSKITMLTYSRRVMSLINNDISSVHDKNWYLLNSAPNELQYSQYDLRILEADIRSITNSAKVENASVIFVNLPSKHLLLQTRSNYKKTGTKYKVLEGKITEICQKNNARYISFFDYLSETNPDVNSLFFSCDNHYSDYGHFILSAFIIRDLQNK